MAKTLRERVRGRAADCCEYCHMPQRLDVQPFQIDHIRAEKHGGRTTFANLALACLPCNAFKGPNVAGYDPLTNALQRLFDPRRDEWNDHFIWNGPILVGRTPVGRTTIVVLGINVSDRIGHRQLLLRAGLFPHELPPTA
jgi:hypothetical protein